jgi:RHS repeat-associated protein
MDVAGYLTTSLPAADSGVEDQYGWDAEQRLVRFQSQDGIVDDRYSYNSSGIRVAVISKDGSKHMYLAGLELKTDPTGRTVLARREYGFVGTPVAIREITATSNTVSWLAGSTQGSIVAMINSTGQTGRRFHTPYGTDRKPSTITATDRGYIGQHTDQTTGLNYLNARYLDPVLGRFISVDPLVASTRDAYGYGNNNPITFSDPSGLCSFEDTCVEWSDDPDGIDAFMRGEKTQEEVWSEGRTTSVPRREIEEDEMMTVTNQVWKRLGQDPAFRHRADVEAPPDEIARRDFIFGPDWRTLKPNLTILALIIAVPSIAAACAYSAGLLCTGAIGAGRGAIAAAREVDKGSSGGRVWIQAACTGIIQAAGRGIGSSEIVQREIGKDAARAISPTSSAIGTSCSDIGPRK